MSHWWIFGRTRTHAHMIYHTDITVHGKGKYIHIMLDSKNATIYEIYCPSDAARAREAGIARKSTRPGLNKLDVAIVYLNFSLLISS